jgi:hypothetical protein
MSGAGRPGGLPIATEGTTVQSRTIVAVSDRLAYANGWAIADYRAEPAGTARAQMDAFLAKYRLAGWWIVDQRPEASQAA